MDDRLPKLFTTLKGYTPAQLGRDAASGFIVAIITLPMVIALALGAGATPEQGLYTAVAAGFIISLMSGSSVQIAGPTATLAAISAGVSHQDSALTPP